jgi:hypothetical protein
VQTRTGRWAQAAKEFERDLLVVMRVYFEKPRTTVGWKARAARRDLTSCPMRLLGDPVDQSYVYVSLLRLRSETVE